MIGSLTARIFAIFWLTLALVLMLVLMLPKLDSRQMTELLDSEQRQGLMIEQHVEAELAKAQFAQRFNVVAASVRAIDKWAPPGQRLLLVTTEGRVIGAEHSEIRRSFVTLLVRPITPIIRRRKSMAAWNWSVRSPYVMAKIITNFI